MVVTVDCGITAHAPLAAAAEAGLDVIVSTTTSASRRCRARVAVVNPNRLDETSPHGMLAAVGVAFLLAVGAQPRAAPAGWYARRGRSPI